ncbi:PilZ domain-containing protein [Thalassotalea profundi]|uniref:Cyclic diguanosine monophosphate-binding protein n=1 Tax=Thalassotalea profundi TaxID=2036687 RepID=A0ABQ3IIM9_9GAMM|nr:PilZ domain-containing protein [Thalassotalea profundi]GHE81459.1 cyclic diguanosine monophosphate-binding protein [Thalassotalea profundi]
MENRRQFTRILFSINASLEVEEQHYPVKIHDISLNGALVSRPETENTLLKKLGVLRFVLSESEVDVEMHIAVVHQEGDEIGLRCNAIDIDSISYLKRLIELNLGDESQLNKELSQLTKAV